MEFIAALKWIFGNNWNDRDAQIGRLNLQNWVDKPK